MVLLKNEGGVLPLKDQSLKIAVIGPNADDVYRQIGDYSPPLKPFQKDGAGKEMQAGTGVTVWEGLLQSAQGRSLRFIMISQYITQTGLEGLSLTKTERLL